MDVPKVPGVAGPNDPLNRNKSAAPDGDKFKDLMKVGDTDADQKKKKKQRQEALEETKAKAALNNPITEKEKTNVDLQKFRKPAKVERAVDSDAKHTKPQKRAEESPPARIEHKKTSLRPKPRVEPELLRKDHRKETPAAVSSQKNEPIPPKPEEETPEPEEVAAFSPTPTPPQEPPKKEEPKNAVLGAPPIPMPMEPLFLLPASAIPPSFTLLKPEVFALLEKLVSMIMVMNESGMTETIIHLSPDEFKAFAGAQIVIREYATAPKAFNVEFQGNAQNTAVFQQSVGDLMAAFQYGQYNFKINRIDTSLLAAERPLFHRKDEAGDKDSKEGDSNES